MTTDDLACRHLTQMAVHMEVVVKLMIHVFPYTCKFNRLRGRARHPNHRMASTISSNNSFASEMMIVIVLVIV